MPASAKKFTTRASPERPTLQQSGVYVRHQRLHRHTTFDPSVPYVSVLVPARGTHVSPRDPAGHELSSVSDFSVAAVNKRVGPLFALSHEGALPGRHHCPLFAAMHCDVSPPHGYYWVPAPSSISTRSPMFVLRSYVKRCMYREWYRHQRRLICVAEKCKAVPRHYPLLT